MNILITGATGFIGSHLVHKLLLSKEHNLFCLVRKSSDVSFLKNKNVNLIYADITYLDMLRESLKNISFDGVFHCAGHVENKNFKKLTEVNIIGIENICRICLEKKIPQMIYLSSVAVVSGNQEVPLTENLPFKASNIYGQSKLEAEKLVLNYRAAGLNVSILRPCMVYGEGERHLLGLILKLIKLRALPLLEPAENKLHLVYVKNVVDAMLFALQNERTYKGTFFIADNEVLSVKEVFSLMAKILGSKPPFMISKKITPLLSLIPNLRTKISFFEKDRIYDISQFKSIGFVPRFSAYEGIESTVKYWLKNKNRNILATVT